MLTSKFSMKINSYTIKVKETLNKLAIKHKIPNFNH